jgi:hypothetical protein
LFGPAPHTLSSLRAAKGLHCFLSPQETLVTSPAVSLYALLDVVIKGKMSMFSLDNFLFCGNEKLLKLAEIQMCSTLIEFEIET